MPLVDQLRGLENGLPEEDQFIALITWLGKCTLVHKLDQDLYPSDADTNFRVPDLLAVFNRGTYQQAVAIEVKSNKGKKLDWTPKYDAAG